MLVLCTLLSVLPVIGNVEAAQTGWIKETRTAGSAWKSDEYKYSYYQYRDPSTNLLLNNTWKKIGGKWYYFTEYDDKYNFSSYGRMAADEWVDGYWFNKDGSWTYKKKASWKHDKKGYYYSDTSGWYAKGWAKIDGKDYYFNSKGYMVKGWQKIGSRYYYFKASGAMAAHETLKLSGKSYYFFGDGSYN